MFPLEIMSRSGTVPSEKGWDFWSLSQEGAVGSISHTETQVAWR